MYTKSCCSHRFFRTINSNRTFTDTNPAIKDHGSINKVFTIKLGTKDYFSHLKSEEVIKSKHV